MGGVSYERLPLLVCHAASSHLFDSHPRLDHPVWKCTVYLVGIEGSVMVHAEAKNKRYYELSVLTRRLSRMIFNEVVWYFENITYNEAHTSYFLLETQLGLIRRLKWGVIKIQDTMSLKTGVCSQAPLMHALTFSWWVYVPMLHPQLVICSFSQNERLCTLPCFISSLRKEDFRW